MISLIAVVATIAFLVSRQTEERGALEFYAAADESSRLHSEAAELFRSTIAEIGPLLTRQEVTRRFDDMTSKAVAANDLLDLEVPPAVGTSYGLIASASESWLSGVIETERVILGIMDGEITQAGELELQHAFDLLGVGDVGYQLFMESLESAPEGVMLPDFVDVAYVAPDPDDPLLFDAQNIVLRIEAAYNLSPRVDVSVIGAIEPEPVGDRGGIPLVPFSSSIGVQAVISNVGNEIAEGVEVSLNILNVDTGTSFTRSERVANIDPGASTTVSFSNLAIDPGGLYQSVLTVTIADDNDVDNNSWSMTFIWNGES